MRLCDLSLGTPAESLACDEALLELSEAGAAGELLRFGEPAQYFVVLGYANRRAREVNVDFCHRNDIPIFRRCSGGGTVLQGPGCLNYSLILSLSDPPSRLSIPATNQEVLQKHADALSRVLSASVQKQGQTDLALASLKFSGNAQRRQKHFLLFHGSFLLHLDLELMEKILPMPSHQPAYRAERSHREFLVNLEIPAQEIRIALAQAWGATEPLRQIPNERIASLARNKYAQESWNGKL